MCKRVVSIQGEGGYGVWLKEQAAERHPGLQHCVLVHC